MVVGGETGLSWPGYYWWLYGDPHGNDAEYDVLFGLL
jgi:hypothetical protein